MKRFLILIILIVSSCGTVTIVDPDIVDELSEEWVEVGVSDEGERLIGRVRLKNDIPRVLFYSQDFCFNTGSTVIFSLREEDDINSGRIVDFHQNRDISCISYLEDHLIGFKYEGLETLLIKEVIIKNKQDSIRRFNITNNVALREIFLPLM